MPSMETVLFEMFENFKRNMRGQPLYLGGISASGGGVGGPPGGFVGLLPQTRVAYDASEAVSDVVYVASGMTLVDNLNHIRYWLSMISGCGDPNLMILQSGELVVSGFKYLNFMGDATLEPFPDGVTVTMTSIPGPQGESGLDGDAQLILMQSGNIIATGLYYLNFMGDATLDLFPSGVTVTMTAIPGPQGEIGIGITDISISVSGVQIASGINNIDFYGNVAVEPTTSGISVTVLGGGGTSDLSPPFEENVGIYTEPDSALHVKASGISQVPLTIEAGGSGGNNLILGLVPAFDEIFGYYTTDCITWTEIPNTISDVSFFQTKSAVYNGTMWLMANRGDYSDTLLYSYNGIDWSSCETPPFLYIYIEDPAEEAFCESVASSQP